MEDSVDEVVGQAWEAARSSPGGLAQKVREVHSALHAWDMHVLKDPRRQLRVLQDELNLIMTGPLSDEATVKIQELQLQIENIHEEEIKHLQRSHATWLKQGDRNTSFFQNFASMRKKINRIKKLKDGNGNWIDDPTALKSHIQGYFQYLFTTELINDNDDVIHKVNPCVTQAMNEILTASYTREEVRKALFSIGDLIAPGPDDLHAIFFKR